MKFLKEKLSLALVLIIITGGILYSGVSYSRMPEAFADGITGDIVYFQTRGMVITKGDPLFKKLLSEPHEYPTPVKHGYVPKKLRY